MSESNWPREAPLPDAYSRVTNAERFRPLHALALARLDWLTAEYDVARTEVFALLPGVQSFEHARTPVTLTPAMSLAAPIAIAFTTFPSLLVRYGRWLMDSFPDCACDACGETAAGEGERLERLIADVVAGHFREEISIPLFGEARLRWALGDMAIRAGHHAEGFRVLHRAEARALHGGGPRRMEWQPWPRRGPPVGGLGR